MNFILDDELFFWYDYILKRVYQEVQEVAFNISIAREELSKIQYLLNQINHRLIIL